MCAARLNPTYLFRVLASQKEKNLRAKRTQPRAVALADLLLRLLPARSATITPTLIGRAAELANRIPTTVRAPTIACWPPKIPAAAVAQPASVIASTPMILAIRPQTPRAPFPPIVRLNSNVTWLAAPARLGHSHLVRTTFAAWPSCSTNGIFRALQDSQAWRRHGILVRANRSRPWAGLAPKDASPGVAAS